MKQVTLSLIPAPGSKPEFLATVEALDDIADWNKRMPSKINLEGYTRDGWAWKPNPSAWIELVCASVDGRNKLPGFLKYLKERNKCAYGRFSPTTVLVVSYIQKSVASDNEMSIRICLDMGKLDSCPLFKGAKAVSGNKQQATPAKPEKRGILGNLLGAQKRTNQHMANFEKQKASSNPNHTAVKSNGPNAADPSVAASETESRTAQQVLAEFREKMEQEMLDFDCCGETSVKVKIALSEMHMGLNDADKSRVTTDVLFFIVTEAAEECNEEWIAHKDPDECNVTVYKEGNAPEEAMEEINRVELTEDMKGEQRAIQEARQRKLASEEAKINQETFQRAMAGTKSNQDEVASALNSNKRDRRTIEEIQRGDHDPSKRQRQ